MFFKLWSLFLLSLLVNPLKVEAKKRLIGHLQTKTHAVKGTVYVLNKDQILIRQFKFNGKNVLNPGKPILDPIL